MGLPRMLRRGLGQSPYRNAAVALSLTLVVMWATDAMRAGRTPSSVPLLFSSPGAEGASGSSDSGGTGTSSSAAGGLTGTCPEGWVLPQIAPAMRDRVEAAAGQWCRDLPTLLRLAYNAASEMNNMAGPVREPAGHARFDVIMPAVTDACPSLTKIGSDWDGGKRICGLEGIATTANKREEEEKEETPCVVYSIGGNNQWDFESDVVKTAPSCRIFTFDCTVEGRVPPNLQEHVTFHDICLGSDTAGGEEGTFMSLKEIMAMLGHDHITLLKMDIEGYEYDVFEEILTTRDLHLPEQIAFELHYKTQMAGLDWWGRERTAGELAMFSRRLYEAGYRVISREDNVHCPHCSEFTVVRFHCPAAF